MKMSKLFIRQSLRILMDVGCYSYNLKSLMVSLLLLFRSLRYDVQSNDIIEIDWHFHITFRMYFKAKIAATFTSNQIRWKICVNPPKLG